MTDWVLGIDGCAKGWVGLGWNGGQVFAVSGGTLEATVAEACRRADVRAVAIDMPIGLPDRTVRQADQLARKAVGKRASSVFNTPIRMALAELKYEEALARSSDITGKGMTKQSFALKSKLYEVEDLVRSQGIHIVEAHPEVSFAAMNAGPLAESKHTWAGSEHRRQLLASAGIGIPSDLGTAGSMAAVDDVIDAGAAAWTAMRVYLGTAHSLPNPPEIFSDELPSAIWV